MFVLLLCYRTMCAVFILLCGLGFLWSAGFRHSIWFRSVIGLIPFSGFRESLLETVQLKIAERMILYKRIFF